MQLISREEYYDGLKNKETIIIDKYIYFFIMTSTIQKCTVAIVLLIIILLFVFHLFMIQSISDVEVHVYRQNYSNPQIRIYCFILTSPKYFDTRARAVSLTWAPRCDKFTFISEYSNNTKGLPIAPIANISSGSAHLTQKTTLALHYIHDNFLNNYEWFVKADDDTYIFVENLKLFLKEKNSSEPITFGYNLIVGILNDVNEITIRNLFVTPWIFSLCLFFYESKFRMFLHLVCLENTSKWLSFWWCRICFKS